MTARPDLLDPAFAACTAQDFADLAAAGLAQHSWPAETRWVSLSRADHAATIVQSCEQGLRPLAIGTIAQKTQRVAALTAGAAEFLTTAPVDAAQLAGRLRLLREGSALPSECRLRPDGTWHLDGVHHALAPAEARLVEALIAAQGGVAHHDDLLAHVWQGRASGRQHLRVLVRRLRHRVEAEPDLPRYLLSEPAIGYRLGIGG